VDEVEQLKLTIALAVVLTIAKEQIQAGDKVGQSHAMATANAIAGKMFKAYYERVRRGNSFQGLAVTPTD
jgi:hypothetical protein